MTELDLVGVHYDDEPDFPRQIAKILATFGFAVQWETTVPGALTKITTDTRLVISDNNDGHGPIFVQKARSIAPNAFYLGLAGFRVSGVDSNISKMDFGDGTQFTKLVKENLGIR